MRFWLYFRIAAEAAEEIFGKRRKGAGFVGLLTLNSYAVRQFPQGFRRIRGPHRYNAPNDDR